MCGRFALETPKIELPEIIWKNLPTKHQTYYKPRFSIRPGEPVLILKREEAKIQTSLVIWGLIPSWSKNPCEGPRPFNARSESINENGFFRDAWRYRRCLIPASCFFEKGWRIKKVNSETFWLAGLWERWMGDEGSELESCTILTTQPNELLKPIHNRMPVIIPEGLEEFWLSDKNKFDLRELKHLFSPWSSNNWLIERIQQVSLDKYKQLRVF